MAAQSTQYVTLQQQKPIGDFESRDSGGARNSNEAGSSEQ